MFSIGFGEIILVVFVAIIVIKPQDLPKVCRAIGMRIGQVKRYFQVMSKEIEKL